VDSSLNAQLVQLEEVAARLVPLADHVVSDFDWCKVTMNLARDFMQQYWEMRPLQTNGVVSVNLD